MASLRKNDTLNREAEPTFFIHFVDWLASAAVMAVMAALLIAGIIHALRISGCSCKQTSGTQHTEEGDDSIPYNEFQNEQYTSSMSSANGEPLCYDKLFHVYLNLIHTCICI